MIFQTNNMNLKQLKIMSFIKGAFSITLLLTTLNLGAQQSTNRYSLEEAQKYALENNLERKNASLG